MVTIPKHVLDLQLKGPQLVSIHAKTVSKQYILTQRDELQRFVDAWGPDNSEAHASTMFVKNYMKSMRNRSRLRTVKATCANMKDLWRIMKQ